ncbi:hypothetical protein GCM10027259_52220 [Micromonospora palomenae]
MVIVGDETVVGGRFDTGRDGYTATRKYAKQWPNRVWAIEGCQGIGSHIANRLLPDGEQIADVSPKLAAWARVFATGQGRRTDATDAHSIALVGTRMAGLRPVVNDEQHTSPRRAEGPDLRAGDHADTAASRMARSARCLTSCRSCSGGWRRLSGR